MKLYTKGGLSLDCRSILFLFTDRGLSKEHIKL